MNKLNRYPGSKPFTIEYKNLFFGRENDINDLCKYLNTGKLTVLYGKSGLGKSSLLNVGIVPKYEKENQFINIPVRFGNYNEFSISTPLEIFISKLLDNKNDTSFLSEIENEDISLWQYFKNMQLKFPQTNGFLIVFDQFEELFSYSNGINEFALQLAELLNNKMPKSFRKTLHRKLKENPDLLTDSQIEFLEQELNLKVIISIRADRLSLLNKLTEFLPNILRNCYELKSLTREQANQAIVLPTKIKNDLFFSPQFDFEQNAINKILDFLTENNTKSIETFQLQILCQDIEENIVVKKNKNIINDIDLNDFENIYKNYYDNLIAKLETKEEQNAARIFIEDGLIFEEDERRLSLYEGQIYKQFGISKQLLQKLSDTHLLRSEPNASGGFNYELCHDTLIKPILQSKQQRINFELNEKQIQKEILLQKELRNKAVKRLKQTASILFIITILIILAFGIYTYWQNKELRRINDEITQANNELNKILNLDKNSEQLSLANKIDLTKKMIEENQKQIKKSDTTSKPKIANDTVINELNQAKLFYQKKEYEKAFQLFLKLANENNSEAFYLCALCYSNGQGTVKNMEQAEKWYLKAAENNHKIAQNDLGIIYANKGEDEKAVKWFEKAANAGLTEAQNNLANMYLRQKNFDKAVIWLKKVANQNYPQAQYNLGQCFELGKGTAKDKEEAIKWYKKAASNNDEKAIKALKRLNQ